MESETDFSYDRFGHADTVLIKGARYDRFGHADTVLIKGARKDLYIGQCQEVHKYPGVLFVSIAIGPELQDHDVFYRRRDLKAISPYFKFHIDKWISKENVVRILTSYSALARTRSSIINS